MSSALVQLFRDYEAAANDYALALAKALFRAGVSEERCITIVGACSDLGINRYQRCAEQERQLFLSAEAQCEAQANHVAKLLDAISAHPLSEIIAASTGMLEDAKGQLASANAKPPEDVWFDAATRERVPPGGRGDA